ncbi:MOB-like protein phocein isoform X2 [Montipora capricornis]|uniref:MOB-like protein phocein isoform X2 n=1 Tax=Montipora capricornis TaxID=246305 RepID=UPI0035F11C95
MAGQMNHFKKWIVHSLFNRSLPHSTYIQQQIRADFTNIGAILGSPEGQDEGVWKYEQFCMELNGLAVRLQRISSKISKRHSLYWRCLQDLRLMFRDPTDLGEILTKETPDSEVLIKDAKMFLKKWQNVKDVSGSQVLSEQAVKEVKKIMEHMTKGCLSGC